MVVFLSVALAVFLILGIWLLVVLIKVSNHIKHITEKAEEIASKAENITTFFEKKAGAMAFGKLISNIADTVFKKEKK